MPPTKLNTRTPPPDTLTADHVVALNMKLFRQTVSLTMKQVGGQLAHFTGQTYTPQSISYWENSAGKENARPCSAQELIGLSRIFDVPVASLVTVPDNDEWMAAPVRGVDRARGRWLFDQFMKDRELAEVYARDTGYFVSIGIVNQQSIKEVYNDLKAEGA